jgi:hypothetical protein
MDLRATSLKTCIAFFLTAAVAAAQNEPKPIISPEPLTTEQLAIYHAVISQWMGKDKRKVNLADQTDPPGGMDSSEDKDCEKGLDLEPAPAAVHHLRPEDAEQIAPGRFRLIDPDSGLNEVKKNDPDNTIRNGGAVDSAVENGFAHGLFTLGEIRFDKSHTHAIVSFSFVCGRLCGRGATLVMKKTAKGWERSGDCDIWISRSSPTPEPRRPCQTGINTEQIRTLDATMLLSLK